MIVSLDKNQLRRKRHRRIRNSLAGTAARPRLCVFRSLSHIYAQIIDDQNHVTLAAANSLKSSYGGNIDAAKRVGTDIANKATAIGISQVVFDRSGYIYHGRVKALAEAARVNTVY